MFIDYALLSKQRWSFLTKLKMNHCFMIGSLFTVSRFSVVNVRFARFAVCFVVKRREERYKGFFKGQRWRLNLLKFPGLSLYFSFIFFNKKHCIDMTYKIWWSPLISCFHLNSVLNNNLQGHLNLKFKLF